MTIEELNNYDLEAKNLILNDMCKLYTLVTDYPTSIEDLQNLTQWQAHMGKFNNNLLDFLIGIYPPFKDVINDKRNINEIKKLSDSALKFVQYWNNCL